LQAYDSVAIEADVEFGGTDQKFNCLMGRELQQMIGQTPQHVFFTPLLIGTDGVQKMSKSLGNCIGIAEAPGEMYGKIMSIPDLLILGYFELVTDVPDGEIAEFRRQLDAQAVNPMTLKKRLAREIITQFHDKRHADKAEEEFAAVFQRRELPENVPECVFAASYAQDGLCQLNMAPTLVREGIVKSNSELKRLLRQGAIELDGEKISTNIINARNGSILKLGKHNFVRIMIR